MVGTVIVDSNIFIFSESKDSPEHALALQKLKGEAERNRVGINAIIISEVFHTLQRLYGGADACSRVNDIFSSAAVDFLALGRDTVLRAAKLARDFTLRINDAMIAQQAIETGAAILTDNVKDFKKIGGIRIIPLRPAR